MIKAVQSAGQQRDEAVQAAAAPIRDHRVDGKRAILVSERATVFDRPSAETTPIDEAVAISDPIWNHKGLTSWTPDLVHCRLLVTGEIVKRMPPVVRRGFVSQLGNIAITEASVARNIPLTPAEISLADWTLWEIMGRPHRDMLLAACFGYSADKIAETVRARGEKISGPTVQRRYLAEKRVLAAQWQAGKVALDRPTIERWGRIFDRQK